MRPIAATSAWSLLACLGSFAGSGSAVAQGCGWGPSAPDTLGARHAFRVECDPGGIAYDWDFGDGSRAATTGPSVAHAYASAGQYVILVRIAMADGDTLSVVGGQTVYRPPTRSRPAHATSILFDAARSRIWTVNPDNHSAVFLEWPSGTRSAEFPVGRRPRTLAQDRRGDIWVCGQEDASLTILEGASGRRLQTITLPRGSMPYAVVVDSDRDLAYVTLQATGRLLKIDAASKRLLAELEATPSARGLAVSHDGARILVTRFLSGPEEGGIVEVDGNSFTVTRRFPLAYDRSPDTEVSGSGVPNAVNCVAITPDGTQAWYTAKKDNVGRGVFRDGRTFTEENTVRSLAGILDLRAGSEAVNLRKDLDNRNMPKAIAFSPDGIFAFIATEGSNTVEVFNVPASERIGAVDPLDKEGELAPQGLVVHPDGGLLFVQYFTSREIGVYDITTTGSFNDFKRVALLKTIGTDSLGEKEALGQRVFYNSADVRMTRSGYVSCSTCHPEGTSDERVWDFTERGEGLRNTTTLLGKGGPGGGPFHWSANFDEIQDFEHDIRGPQKGLGFLSDDLFAQGTRGNPLGDLKAGGSVELDALAAYINTLTQAPASPYRAADGGLTAGAKRGRETFRSAATGCAVCHKGPGFTDSGLKPEGDPASAYAPFHAVISKPGGFVLHDVGTLKPGSGKRLKDTLEGLDTPALHGAWATAPYLHDGSAATLMDVIEGGNPKDRHGRTAQLSRQEKGDLVEYLSQIDGTPEEVSAIRKSPVPAGGFAWLPLPGGGGIFNVATTSPEPAAVSLFAMDGRVAATLRGSWEKRSGDGAWTMAWNGRGNTGRPLPEGVYWARLAAENRQRAVRLVLAGPQ